MYRLIAFCAFWIFSIAAQAEIDFKADYYRKSLQNNSMIGKGNVVFKQGDRQMSADEMEVYFDNNQLIARGHVKITEKNLEIWSDQAFISLNTPEATLDNAKIYMDQTIITGDKVHRSSLTQFEIDNGTFSNCNIELDTNPDRASCPRAWKISGRRFEISFGGYAHFYDVLFYTKSVPLFYTPYLVLPVKSQRQTGLLFPSFRVQGSLGSGAVIPFFIALGPYHDMTLEPGFFSNYGIHLGAEYRYAYSFASSGRFFTYMIPRVFNRDLTLADLNQTPSKPLLGLWGESIINVENILQIGDRTFSRQTLRFVSHPYVTFDYSNYVGTTVDLGYLRSQLFVTHHTDSWLSTGAAQYFQNLLISRDGGTDQGGLWRLPHTILHKKNTSLLDPWISYEIETRFENFYRPQPFDFVPTQATRGGYPPLPTNTYTPLSYLRTGQRGIIEPSVQLNVPMAVGLQFQPNFRTSLIGYHFNYPSSSFEYNGYGEVEIPFSLLFSKAWKTPISGLEDVHHIFQPRMVFVSSLFQTDNPNHPFFFENANLPVLNPATGITDNALINNPRFDLHDYYFDSQYVRLELIQRFRRKVDATSDRFWLMQVSQQLNRKTSNFDPRFKNQIGPVELLSDFRVGGLLFQTQAYFQIEKTVSPREVREYDVASALEYRHPDGDRIRTSLLLRYRAEEELSDEYISLVAFKSLPSIFDIEGGTEYSIKRNEFISYTFGIHFRNKPRSCWHVSVIGGRNAFKQLFTTIGFHIDFGTPSQFSIKKGS